MESPPNTGNIIRLCANTGAASSIESARVFALSTRGSARYDTPRFTDGAAFLFGPETRGLPAEILAQVPEAQRLCVPMCPDNRSLNLSNVVAVVVYEAWRQQNFEGSAKRSGNLDLRLGARCWR